MWQCLQYILLYFIVCKACNCERLQYTVLTHPGSRTTAVLFDPRTNLLPVAAGWGLKCCCWKSQSLTVLLYIFIFFQNFLIQSFHWVNNTSMKCFHYPRPSSSRIWTTPRHCDVNIMWLIEPMKIRSLVNSW